MAKPGPVELIQTLDLAFVRGPFAGETFSIPVRRRCLVGRGEKADIRLGDPAVSRMHAMVEFTGQDLFVEDLKSHNGIFINQTRVTADGVAQPGDFLQLGGSLIQVVGVSLRDETSTSWEFATPEPMGEATMRTLPSFAVAEPGEDPTNEFKCQTWQQLEPMGPTDLEPDAIPGYQLCARLQSSGPGRLYLAAPLAETRARLGITAQHVALRCLGGSSLPDDARALVQLEAAKAIRLQHPHMLRIFQQGTTPDRLFVVTEHTGGVDLGYLLRRRGPLTAGRAVPLARQTLAALHTAHAAGQLHGALTPSQILCTADDWVRLDGFGVGRALLAIGWTGGWASLAPEQQRAGELSPRTDLYAFAATFYQLLSGRRPPKPSKGRPRPTLAELVSGFPPALSDLIAWCMAAHPEERPASAARVEGLLAGIEAEL